LSRLVNPLRAKQTSKESNLSQLTDSSSQRQGVKCSDKVSRSDIPKRKRKARFGSSNQNGTSKTLRLTQKEQQEYLEGSDTQSDNQDKETKQLQSTDSSHEPEVILRASKKKFGSVKEVSKTSKSRSQLNLSSPDSPQMKHIHNRHSHNEPIEIRMMSPSYPDLTDSLDEVEKKSILQDKRRTSVRIEHFLKQRPTPDQLKASQEAKTEAKSQPESPKVTDDAPTIRTALLLFNQKPAKGVQMIIDNKLLDDPSPAGIAKFFYHSSLIDKRQLGDYLGDPADLSCRIRDCILDLLDFSRLEFDMALRRFLDVFRLPGEAQKIDRLVQAFASKFYSQQNSMESVFLSEDAAYILSFSTVMLNTDIHNPSVKRKMTKEQFCSQNKGVNKGEDFPAEFLEDLYDTICEDEIKEHTLMSNAFKRGWLQMGISRKEKKRRWIMLDENGLYCFKNQESINATSSIPLESVTGILLELKSKKFEFKVKTSKEEYSFGARSERSASAWVSSLQYLRSKKKRTSKRY